MTKKMLLSAFAILLASFAVMAQSDPQPAPVSKTSPADKSIKAEKARQTTDAAKAPRAEERSNGAAYSGKGKGGDKNTAEKEKRGKHKAKGKNKGKHKGKAKGKTKDKQKNKAYRGKDAKSDPMSKGYEGPDDAPGNIKTQKSEKAKQEKAPRTPTPGTTPSRKPGDKPTPGTEKQRG